MVATTNLNALPFVSLIVCLSIPPWLGKKSDSLCADGSEVHIPAAAEHRILRSLSFVPYFVIDLLLSSERDAEHLRERCLRC